MRGSSNADCVCLSFVALLLMVCWLVDRRARRIRRGLDRPAVVRSSRGSVDYRQAGRVASDTAARAHVNDQPPHGP